MTPPSLRPLAAVLALCLALCLGLAGAAGPASAASAAPVAGEHGMVVTAQHLATEAGVDVLKQGGNAVDAAVAVGYALAVVYPAAGNLGGGGFMTLQLADGTKTFLDFRERAPLAASADMYLDAAGNVVRGATVRGHLAVAVPGTVSGLETARAKYGTMTRAELIAPAIRLAEQGFVLDAGDAEMLAIGTEAFRADAASAAIFLDQGRPFAAGARLVQRDLAATLKQIAEAGVAGFYQGPVAEAIAASSRVGKGLITLADLAQYTTRERAPIECDYRGYHVVFVTSPSQYDNAPTSTCFARFLHGHRRSHNHRLRLHDLFDPVVSGWPATLVEGGTFAVEKSGAPAKHYLWPRPMWIFDCLDEVGIAEGNNDTPIWIFNPPHRAPLRAGGGKRVDESDLAYLCGQGDSKATHGRAERDLELHNAIMRSAWLHRTFALIESKTVRTWFSLILNERTA